MKLHPLFHGFYRLSDWNPQLFREVKGRLKPRNFLITLTASLGLQALVFMFRLALLPDAEAKAHAYCTGDLVTSYSSAPLCLQDAAGNLLINWQLWWEELFIGMSWALPFILLISGVYLLIGDVGREEKRGTLNFIRTSPQSSQRILLGKLLGVPIVPLLAVVLAVPLHWMAASGAGVPLPEVLSLYLFSIAVCAFAFTAALLYAFLGGFQGWVGAIAVWFGYSFFFSIWQGAENYGNGSYLGLHQWYYLNIGSHLGLALPFALISLGVGTFWLWKGVNRRFRNPNSSLWSKRQSYAITALLELWMVGFAFYDYSNYDYPPRLQEAFCLLGFFNLLWFVVLLAALTPQRQTLLDWARYRRQTSGQRSRFKDLLLGEKSPALLALAVNLLIACTIASLWVAGWNNPDLRLQAFGAMVLGVIQMLIVAAIAQLILLMKGSRRAIWAAGVCASLTVLPPIALSILSIYPQKIPLAWLFTIGAVAALENASAMTAFMAALSQLGIFSLLALRLTRHLHKAGESQTKALLAGSKI